MRVLFVINPRARRGASLKVWKRISDLVARTTGCEAVIPSSYEETRKAARDAVKAGYDRVVAVGGDGTVGAVAGELVLQNTTLGVIPAGTGNDFCRNFGISQDSSQALAVALGPGTQRIDLGQAAGGQYIMNAAGIGFDAEVAAVAAGYPNGLGGTLPYLLGALSTLTWYKPAEYDIIVDGERYAGRSTMIAIANGRYYGGGMQIAPMARTDDGLLEVCIAGELGRLELLRLLGQVYSGSHVRHPKVRTTRGRQVELRPKRPVRAHVDGDLLGAEALTFRACPGALSVAMPASRG